VLRVSKVLPQPQWTTTLLYSGCISFFISTLIYPKHSILHDIDKYFNRNFYKLVTFSRFGGGKPYFVTISPIVLITSLEFPIIPMKMLDKS
jgi:hypothetical protein